MSGTLAPLRPTNGAVLGDAVYAAIGAAILDGTLPAGERVRDTELAAQLGVSRTPVREALQRLERFGLVEVAVGKYTRVSDPDDKAHGDSADFIAYFLGTALHLVLSGDDEDAIADVTRHAERLAVAAAGSEPLALFDEWSRFIDRVILATGNVVYRGVLRETALTLRRNLRGWHSSISDPTSRGAAYARLSDDISARDADAAEHTLRVLRGIA